MIVLNHTVAGDACQIFMPERRSELHGFRDFLSRGDKVLGLDTETTGLDIYSRGYGSRLVQFGNPREAWVMRVDLFRDEIIKALRQPRHFALHNAPFDLLVIDRTLGVKVEELAGRVFDTRIFAHLLDPRQPHEGGAGLALKPLSAIYVDPDAPDTQAGLYAEFRKVTNPDTGKPCNKDDGWRHIPIDNELYVRYAGLDVLLEARLFSELAALIKGAGLSALSTFEHHLMGLLCLMQRRGLRLDMDYVNTLDGQLEVDGSTQRNLAARYGVEAVGSPAQVSAALVAMGEELTETTGGGALKVDKGVLLPLADLDMQWQRIGAREPNPLADAVLRAKRADKWRASYVGAFREMRDEGDRIHPSIGGLQARTARMSVSRPALQQLPSKDATIRRAIVADEGQLLVAADYSQVELRVLAALADVRRMKDAIASGEDLHGYTATLVYGPDFTKFQRGLMKGVGFGKVYGGGKATLARQTGAPVDAVAHAIAEYDRVFPEIKRYSNRLQRRAEYGRKEVVTVSGRHLPLDRDRLYAGTNYVIQSTARDVLAQAIVDAFDAGLGDGLLLPVHDELIGQAPAGEAAEYAAELGRIMSGNFYGVHLEAEGEVIGRNWGAAYGADKDAGIW